MDHGEIRGGKCSGKDGFCKFSEGLCVGVSGGETEDVVADLIKGDGGVR